VKSRGARRRILERIAEIYEAMGDLADAERARGDAGDAGLYLNELATLGEERESVFLRRIEGVRASLEREARWSESDEWRIGTVGTDAIEALPGGYRAVTDHHGTFSGDFETFAEAYEAMTVLGAIQRDLFYAVGWSSWAGWHRLTQDDPPRSRREDDQRLEYLYRLSRAARDEAVPELGDELVVGRRSFRRSTRPWGDDRGDVPVVEVEVRERSLSMSCASPTVERAAEFAGIYERLQDDLRVILGWRWI
jgi:hypothetical protein